MLTVTMIAAQSLDGFIARQGETGTAFCSEEDRAFLRSALKGFDSMVMGRKTFDTLRDQIVASTSTRYLRKIVTRSPSRFAALERPGLVEFTNATPSDILGELADRGRKRCALLGGGEIYGSFLKAGLVDELWLTVEPVVFGAGTPLVTGPVDKWFSLTDCKPLGSDTALLKYVRRFPKP